MATSEKSATFGDQIRFAKLRLFRSTTSAWPSRLFAIGTVGITLLLLFTFLVWPIGLIISKAFFDADGFTLTYFSLLFSNDLQLTSITNSLMIGLATTIICTLLSIPLAVVNSRFEFRGKQLLMGLLLVPMVLPPFVGAIGLQRFFARFGSVNIFLLDMRWIDHPIEWLGSENMFWAVVVLEVLHLYPIMYLNLTSALSNIDPSLDEMAKTLGASRWRRYVNIIWPLARPGYIAGASIIFIWALTDLGTPLLVGFHDVMPVRIFNMVSDINDNPVGFALVFVVIVFTVFFFLLSKLTVKGKKYEMLGRGHVTSAMGKAHLVHQLWIYPLLAITIFAALIPHISVLIASVSDHWFMTPLPESYTLKYYTAIFHHDLATQGIMNSFIFASLSTILDLVLGLFIAFIVTRRMIPFAGWLDALVMVPLALPGIVLAFSYVIAFSGTWLDPLNNPIPLLVIAYGIRRLPYMVRSASAGLQQTSVALEEASESMGASRFYTLRKVTIPLLMANLIAGSLLCFSYAMLDVSDSMILAMKDRFYPLTKAIYSLYLEQGSGEFVASALGMISMVILAACILGASAILGKKMGELFKSA